MSQVGVTGVLSLAYKAAATMTDKRMGRVVSGCNSAEFSGSVTE